VKHTQPLTHTQNNIDLLCVHSFPENVALQGAFKLNGAPAAAETWHLKGCTLKIKVCSYLQMVHVYLYNYLNL
jgi:hypothetical protein